MMTRILVFLLSTFLLALPALGADTALILGSDGEVAILASDATSRTLGVSLSKDAVNDARYDATSGTLLCTDTGGHLYGLRPFDGNPVYEVLDGGTYCEAALVDRRNRPVKVVDTSTSGALSFRLEQRDQNGWVGYRGEGLLFERKRISSRFLPDGRLTKTQIVAKYPFTASSLTSFTAQSEWILDGKSETNEIYGLVVADTPVGLPLKVRLVVIAPTSATSHVVMLDEYATFIYLFRDNVVLRADTAVSTDGDDGGVHFSGNYYVFDLQTGVLHQYALGTGYEVLGSTVDRLFLGKDNCVYAQPIGGAQGAMSLLATLYFEPFQVFPLTRN